MGIYNDFIFDLPGGHVKPNSVTTACFTGRNGSYSAQLRALFDGASMIFITGGDQNLYYDYWRDSSVSDALRRLTMPASQGGMGRPLGGSSAGLAVQSEYSFFAEHGPFDSDSALKDPLKMSLVTSFLDLATPWMRHIVADTHFMQRDRMGRLVAFLGAALSQGWISQDAQAQGVPGVLGIGVSEHTAVLLDPATGLGSLWGEGPAYFLATGKTMPSKCDVGEPLEFANVSTWRWRRSDGPAAFDFGAWAPSPLTAGKRYTLTATHGQLISTGNGGDVY